MLRRIRDYVLALAVILAAYLIYAQTVVRLIEPAPLARSPRDPFKPSIDVSRRNPFEHLFQPGDWELGEPKVLMTSQGTLLFLDYRPLEKGRLEIRPCTLIVYSKDSEGEIDQSARPVVMQAQEGALLQFDEEVDLSRGQFGRLIGGRIVGDIRVFSLPSHPGADDGLELTTRNLQIDRLKARTPHEVKFRYGASFGSGRDLEITLAPSEHVISGNKKKTPPVGGIDSLQLAHIDQIMIASKQGSLMPGMDRNSKPAEQAPVRITCEGPFRFDVTRRVATFDDNVLIERFVPVPESHADNPSKVDRLRCQQLAVFLSADSDDRAGKKQDVSTTAVERIVAVGNPVVLEAPSQSAYTTAERLEYNLKTRQVLLKSLNQGAEVLLRRGSDEFVAPEMAYELVEGKRLGKLWAPGPGRLTASAGGDASKRTFAAQWNGEIRLRPHESNQLLSLTDGAQIDVEGQGSFKANELHLWLLELPSAGNGANRDEADPLGGGSVLPDRLLASGNVHADSPQLSLDVQELRAWFTHTPVELPPATLIPGPGSRDELRLDSPEGRAEPVPRQPIVRISEPLGPVETAAPEQPADAAAPSAKVQHFHLTGELVRLQIEQRGKVSSIDQIDVEGKQVRIVETNAAAADKPFLLEGSHIHLEGGVGPNSLITVVGQPAVIGARGMTVRSNSVRLSRRDNRVTIAEPGEMTLPIEQDFRGQTVEDSQQLTITWKGSMVFDGIAAKFRRTVLVRGATYSARAEELQAVLASQIDFSRAKPVSQRPEIKRLVMTGGAEFENRTYSVDDGRQQTVERMFAKSLEVDRSTGAIQGAGPGWLSRVQVGTPQAPGGPPTASATPSAEQGLTYLRVDFREELRGNLNNRQVEFRDQVQAVYGPVGHWDEMLEPSSRDALGERGLVLTADSLQVAEFLPPGAKKGSLEMSTLGNTRIEGRDFTASSHRLTYAAAKSQLVLEGDGRNDAEIRHQHQNSVAAQKIMYWQDNGKIELHGGKGINIGPTSTRPAPPSPRDIRQPR